MEDCCSFYFAAKNLQQQLSQEEVLFGKEQRYVTMEYGMEYGGYFYAQDDG